jgi:hypothetical protein
MLNPDAFTPSGPRHLCEHQQVHIEDVCSSVVIDIRDEEIGAEVRVYIEPGKRCADSAA